MQLNHLEMEGFELQQAGLEVKSTAGLNAGLLFVGREAWDSTLGYPVVYNGSGWVPMGGAGPVAFSQFPLGTLGYPIIGQGASAPIYGQVSFATGITGTLQSGQMPTFTGDVTNVALAMTVAFVGGSSAAAVNTAVGQAHTQNTDTGTTSTTFQFGTGGVKGQTVTGEFQLRNAANTDYADLRVKSLYQEGSTTILNANEVNIGDSNVLLNWEIATAAANSDGGITVKRLIAPAAGAGTVSATGAAATGVGTTFTGYTVGDALVVGAEARLIIAIASNTAMTLASGFTVDPSASVYSVAVQRNAQARWNNSTGFWELVTATGSGVTTHRTTRTYEVNIPGNGVLLQFDIVHDLGIEYPSSVMLWELTGSKRGGGARYESIDANTLRVKFGAVVANASTYKIVIGA